MVDDTADIGFLVSVNLEAAGHVTRVRHDGAEVTDDDIAWAEALVTDLAMPGEDGVTLSTRVRTSRPGLPIIVLTAMPVEALSQEDRSRLAAADVVYVEKPASVEELIEAVTGASHG